MNGLTNYITEWKWNDIITSWYVLIDDEYQAVMRQSKHKIRSRGPEPLMSDSEVITFNIQRPRARSLQGHVVRITSCILAHTLSFFMVS